MGCNGTDLFTLFSRVSSRTAPRFGTGIQTDNLKKMLDINKKQFENEIDYKAVSHFFVPECNRIHFSELNAKHNGGSK